MIRALMAKAQEQAIFFVLFFYLKKCFLPRPSLGMMYHILWWCMLLVRHIVFYFRDNQAIYQGVPDGVTNQF